MGIGWLRLPKVNLGKGGRFDRRAAGLLIIMAAGGLNLAMEERRNRLVWSELPGGGEKSIRAAASAPPRAAARPAAASVGGTTASPKAAEPRRPAERRPTGPLDLNRATAQELDALPGLGPALARRIVAYRESHGPFRAVPELDQVPGIGPSRLARLAELLCVKDAPGESR
jgi:competence ComEA-like helix-hairpin-helix protein